MNRNSRNNFWGLSVLILIFLSGGFLMTDSNSNAHASAGGASTQNGWRLLEPGTYENISVFPVVSAQGADTSAFATLDEALASGDVVVTEQGSAIYRTRDGSGRPPVTSGAQVNQLVLINRGKKPLLLLAGEVVSGGKQDRIIGKDRIVPIGAEPLPLDVFCVERGRWTGGSAKFASAMMMAHPTVREKAAVDEDQARVWAAVRGQASMSSNLEVEMNGRNTSVEAAAAAPPISARSVDSVVASAAPTESYQKIYQSTQVSGSVENFAEQVQKRFERAAIGLKGERVVGVVVAYGGEVAWSDIFASSQLFEAYWPKLLRSYVVEALTRHATRETVSLTDARDFLRPASGRTREETEPGVYRWRERTEGKAAEIELEALDPKPLTLHWLKVLRLS